MFSFIGYLVYLLVYGRKKVTLGIGNKNKALPKIILYRFNAP